MDGNNFGDRWKAKSAAVRKVSLSMGARFLYVLLDDLDYASTGQCWPKQTSLAVYLGVSVRTVRYLLAELTKAGLVVIERKKRYLLYRLSWAIRDRQWVADHGPLDRQRVAGDDRQWVADHGPSILYESNYAETNGDRRQEEWSEIELGLAEWLRGFPGANQLPPGPDIEIVRQCLATANDPREVTAALRDLDHARKRPVTSWGWFPVVLRARMKRRA